MFVQKLYIVRSRIYKILASFQKMFNIYSSNPIINKHEKNFNHRETYKRCLRRKILLRTHITKDLVEHSS